MTRAAPSREMMESQRRIHWQARDVFWCGLYFGCLAASLAWLPNNIWDPKTRQVIAALGIIGIWRYGWWFLHFVRAQIYQRIVFPRRRRKAEELWRSRWRPRTVSFMLTTFKERRATTELVLESIIRECRELGVPARIFLGTGDVSDERIVEDYVNRYAQDIPLEVILIRQNQPGKRFAIGLALRCMARNGIGGDDPVIFMDGDSVLGQGCLRKCLPFFQLHDRLQALTTDEQVTVFGPRWVQAWLEMRFAQRHLVMQSHALSNKVLTLTGRMSVFRAKNVVNTDFIRTIEADQLNHWLWGDFRFLSGDDKSTWYWLLKQRADMFYVPDALVHTIEHIEGNGVDRMTQNFLRWSGNVLRNGARAIALGPKCMGGFIWWCLIDQRIAMWTTLVGPVGAIATTLLVTPAFAIVYVIWIAFTRMLLSLVLFCYAGRIRFSFPLFLFANQILNAVIKIYLLFRLPMQRWMNRGDQRGSAQSDPGWRMKRRIAWYLTATWVTAFVFFLLTYAGLLPGFSVFDLMFLLTT